MATLKATRKHADRAARPTEQYVYMLSFGERALPDGSLKQLYVLGRSGDRAGLFGHIQRSIDQASRLFDCELQPIHITKWKRLSQAPRTSTKLSLLRMYLNCTKEWPGIDGGYALPIPVDDDSLSFIMSGYYRC